MTIHERCSLIIIHKVTMANPLERMECLERIGSNGYKSNICGAFCLGGVMVILRDCGSLDLGSIPGPGLRAL